MFPPSALPQPRRPSHHKKRPASHIPRPPNAFILFRANFIRDPHVHVPSTGPLSNVSPTTLSTIVGMTWRNLPEEERSLWNEKARVAREEHKRLYPSYRYQPAPTADEKAAARATKRKMKEGTVPRADVERCEEISRLLVEGLRGEELEAAIKSFDETRASLKREEVDHVTALTPSRSSSLPNSPRRVKAPRRTRSHSPRRGFSNGHLPPYSSTGLYSTSCPYPISYPSPEESELDFAPAFTVDGQEPADSRMPDLTFDAASPLSISLPEEQDVVYVPNQYMVDSPTHLSFTSSRSDSLPPFAPSHTAPGPSPLFSSFSSLTGWDVSQTDKTGESLIHMSQTSPDIITTSGSTYHMPTSSASMPMTVDPRSFSSMAPFDLYNTFKHVEHPFEAFSNTGEAFSEENVRSGLQHRSMSSANSNHCWTNEAIDLTNYHDGLSSLCITSYSPSY